MQLVKQEYFADRNNKVALCLSKLKLLDFPPYIIMVTPPARSAGRP